MGGEKPRKGDFLKNQYIKRFGGAKLGIYGNSREEAFYPLYKQLDGEILDGSKSSYKMIMTKKDQDIAKAFWSLTMYDAFVCFRWSFLIFYLTGKSASLNHQNLGNLFFSQAPNTSANPRMVLHNSWWPIRWSVTWWTVPCCLSWRNPLMALWHFTFHPAHLEQTWNPIGYQHL